MSRWEDEARSRLTMLAALDEAEADLEAGHFTDYGDASLQVLGSELKAGARVLRQR